MKCGRTPPGPVPAGLACLTMSGQGRPSVDVHAVLETEEWRELFGEALRLSGFWNRTAGVTVAVVVGSVAAAALGLPTAPTAAVAGTALAAVAVFAGTYALVGPRLRRPTAAQERLAVRWQVAADRIEAYRGDERLTLDWTDVDQVVVTRRLIVLRRGERREVLGLPRRVATPVGETLITDWAEDSGAVVTRRASA